MQRQTLRLGAFAFGGLCGAAFFSSSLMAQDGAARFAEPVQLHAGQTLLGVDRLYPSPMWHDMDGDGHADLVIGDLRGRLTVALREAGAGPLRFAAETKLMAVDGKELDFGNW